METDKARPCAKSETKRRSKKPGQQGEVKKVTEREEAGELSDCPASADGEGLHEGEGLPGAGFPSADEGGHEGDVGVAGLPEAQDAVEEAASGGPDDGGDGLDEGSGGMSPEGGDVWPSGADEMEAGASDDRVAQAQECLSDRWFEAGATTIVCEGPDLLDEEGDLGRYDVHDPHQLGELGEHIAARYLKRWGYTILERNYRTEYGEADIVCTKDDTVVLVEVKTRLGADALPEEAVTAQKIRKYRKITLSYTMGHEWFDSVRLDVLAINIVKPRRAQVHHFMGVCEWEG